MDFALTLSESQSLWTLFSSAFIASTVAPGGSELVLAYLVNQGLIKTPTLLATAALGNTLGALTTLYLGQWAARRWSPDDVRQTRKKKAINALRKHGYPALLFSWLPLIGDGFCFAAGWLKLSVLWSLVFIAIGKTLRYAVVIGLVHHL